jgi:hypothetical protein
MNDTLDFSPLNYGMGWLGDIAAAEARRIVASDGILKASQVIRNRVASATRIDLTKYLEAVWGPQWYLSQENCGSCVAFGQALACDILMAVKLVLSNSKEKPLRVDPMTIYWGSRVEVGGGRIWGEGSVGVWAAKWVSQWGALPQQKFAEADLSRYDPGFCCGANSRRGVPDGLEPTAKQYPVKNYVQVRNFNEAVPLLEAGYPITVASNQGFKARLDSKGFATPSGTWSHQMCVAGYGLGDRPFVDIANSWGPFYTGGPPDQSPAVMKVDAAVFDRMAAAGDTWAYSDFTNWQRPALNFAPLNF